MSAMIRLIMVVLVLLSTWCLNGQTIRAIDGANNNSLNPEWGSFGDELFGLTSSSFGDGISGLTGQERPNPRVISNHMFAQEELIFDEQNLSDFIWVFGQFIDHEIVLVDDDVTESLAISIPEDDPVFVPNGAPIGMFRSQGMLGTGTSEDNVRKYANEITAFIDGSVIYGSSMSRATWLRSFEGGKLKMSQGNLLPWNTITGEFNDPRDPVAPHMEDPIRNGIKHFVTGDVRANENPLLITFHTLFAREHNRICDDILIDQPELEDEEVYQKARRIVGGILQSIVYSEWLPAMGIKLPEYSGYRNDVNPQISNVFSAAAFRMGHTLINSNVLRLDGDGEEIQGGHISLRDAFFNPTVINLAGGIDPYLRGMASQVQQRLDCKVIDDVRNFLFGHPSQGGLDLASININRGRERGLGDFNQIREDIGLPRLRTFGELTSDPVAQQEMLDLYGSIDNIDPWVGMLAEDYMPGAMFGSTIRAILQEQFQRLRDGDKFFFEADPVLTVQEKSIIRQTTMRDIIMRNSEIKVMQENVFLAVNRDEIALGPDLGQEDLNAIAYPNPTSGIFNIKMYAEEDFSAQIDIYNDIGQRLSTYDIELFQGDNTIPFEIRTSHSSQFYNVVIRKGIQYKILRVFRP